MPDQVKRDEGHREEDNEESVISYSYRSLEVSNVAEKHAQERWKKMKIYQSPNLGGKKGKIKIK